MRLPQKAEGMTYRDGKKIANRKLCVWRDLCHLLQILLSEEMVKFEGRVEGCGSLRKRKAEVRTNINSPGLREGKAKWERMRIEVETNGTGSEVDVNLFLSSTLCLLKLYPQMTVAKHSKLSSGLIQIEHPSFLMLTVLMLNM